MRVAFDSVVLGAYLHPEAAYPRPVGRVPERLNHLVETLEAAHAKIIVPTPALSEFLVLAAGDAPAYVAELTKSTVFVVERGRRPVVGGGARPLGGDVLRRDAG